MPKRRLPKLLRAGESDRLLAATKSERDRMMILCGLYLGLRVSEICKLRIEDLDLVSGLALIAQAKGDKDRYVPVPRKLAGPLRTWIGERQQGYVFPNRTGQRFSSRTVQLMIKQCAADAGIMRKVTPHSLRHYFATRLLETGATIVEVQTLLGHANVATTMVYLHADDERLKSAVDRL